MYHPATRVLTVLELLQVHGRMSGPEIAERLEVDLRTVRRYVTMLQDLGIPVEAERGRHGGYRLRPGFRLPPLMLTDEEALSVTLGLHAARRLGLATAAPAVEGALAKVERVLPPDVRRRVDDVQSSLTMEFVSRPEAPATATVLALSAASREGRRVEIRYASAQGDESVRAIDAYGLVHLRGRWYAAAYCHLRHDLRVFRLDRVRSVVSLDDAFTKPDGFDSLSFVQTSLASAPNTWTVEALLDTTIEDARQRIPAHEAILEPAPTGTTIRLEADCLEWAARFLVALGVPFLVRFPDELRVALRHLAARIETSANTVG